MPRQLGNRDGLGPSHAKLPESAAPITADEFLKHLINTQRHQHPTDDDAARRHRFAVGEVLNGKGQPLRPTDRLYPGDEIWFYRMPAEETPVPGHCRPLYSAPGVLIVDKPPFLATMPRGRHITQTATVRLRRATQNDDLVPAHRLDRPTSGLLFFTTAPAFRGTYQTMFATRRVRKTYEAIAPFSPTLAARLAHSPSGLHIHQRMGKTHGFIQARLEEGEPNAETVISSIKILSPDATDSLRQRYQDWPGEPLRDIPYALYRLHPLSGKTHQLRLCLNSFGVPIVGDQVYPQILPEAVGGHMVAEAWHQPLLLRSTELCWDDPILNRPVQVVAPGLLEQLEGSSRQQQES